jgi:hypothetical protein
VSVLGSAMVQPRLFRSVGKTRLQRVKRNILTLTSSAILHFRLAFLEATRTDDHLPRHPDEVHGGELATGPVVGVVIQHLVALGLEQPVQLITRLVRLFVACLEVDQAEAERRHRFRPDDARHRHGWPR